MDTIIDDNCVHYLKNMVEVEKSAAQDLVERVREELRELERESREQ